MHITLPTLYIYCATLPGFHLFVLAFKDVYYTIIFHWGPHDNLTQSGDWMR